MVAGEGGHPAIPIETLSGGEALWSFVLFAVLGYLGMALFTFAALLVYAGFIFAGLSCFAGKFRLPIIALALSGSFALFKIVNWKMLDEIKSVAQTGLAKEQIEKEKWEVKLFGRGRYVCVDWEGRLGRELGKGPS